MRSNSGSAAREQPRPINQAHTINDTIHMQRTREFISSLGTEIGGRIATPFFFTSKLAALPVCLLGHRRRYGDQTFAVPPARGNGQSRQHRQSAATKPKRSRTSRKHHH